MALHDLLRQQLSLTRSFADASRELHGALLRALGPPAFRYHTLEEARQVGAVHASCPTPPTSITFTPLPTPGSTSAARAPWGLLLHSCCTCRLKPRALPALAEGSYSRPWRGWKPGSRQRGFKRLFWSRRPAKGSEPCLSQRVSHRLCHARHLHHPCPTPHWALPGSTQPSREVMHPCSPTTVHPAPQASPAHHGGRPGGGEAGAGSPGRLGLTTPPPLPGPHTNRRLVTKVFIEGKNSKTHKWLTARACVLNPARANDSQRPETNQRCPRQ